MFVECCSNYYYELTLSENKYKLPKVEQVHVYVHECIPLINRISINMRM